MLSRRIGPAPALYFLLCFSVVLPITVASSIILACLFGNPSSRLLSSPTFTPRSSRPALKRLPPSVSAFLPGLPWRLLNGIRPSGHRCWKVFHVLSAQRLKILQRSIDLAGLRGGPQRRNFGRRTLGAPIKCRDCTHRKITAYPVGFSAADGVCLSPGGLKSGWRYSAYAMSLNQAPSTDGTDTHHGHAAPENSPRPRSSILLQIVDSIGIDLS